MTAPTNPICTVQSGTTTGPSNNHQPSLGTSSHGLNVFLAWCARHKLTTIGLRLLAAVPTARNLGLLGGTLGFLTHRQTQAVLSQWAESGTDPNLQNLAYLSQALSLDFPGIPVPPPSQPVSSMLHGQGLISRCYLAASLCTRRPPGSSEFTKEAFAALKLWLLMKSFGFASTGTVHDQSIRAVADHLRMALDGSFPAKFQRFEILLAPTHSPSQFEHRLRAKLTAFVGGGETWQTDCARSIQRLIILERTRISELEEQEEFAWQGLPDSEQVPVTRTVRELEEFSDAAPEDLADSAGVAEPNDQNPSQRVRLSQTIALQGLEDRQYLPWSWNRLRGDEKATIESRLEELLNGGDRTLQLMAAMVHIALLTRNSLHTVRKTPLRSDVQDEWALDVQTGHIHRKPPRREVRWRANDASLPWITPLSSAWQIQLKESIATPLREALHRVPSATLLDDLWDVSSDTPASVFNRWCDKTKGLQRVSSGLLPATAEQCVFNHVADTTFSRLMTAPARAGISGAGAYAAWNMGAVSRAIHAIGSGLELQVGEKTANGLGSELDPDDILLCAAFASARRRMESPERSLSWIEAHNHLTAYTLVLLLAATGARPVNSMFESITHFDFENWRLYIEDKANARGITGPAGRIVPLPSNVLTWLREVYLPHLKATAAHIEQAIPELGTEMSKQATGQGSKKLPLFVFLRNVQGFDWQEVGESGLSALQLFEWPLPWNLFRHRLSIRTRSLGLDPELVDAQLGHAEGGSETHGDWSSRCWLEDETEWRQVIQKALDLLEIAPPALPAFQYTPIQVGSDYRPFVTHTKFGIAARAQVRTEQHRTARATAREDIATFLQSVNKEAHLLSAEEWDELGRSMLFRSGNLPHSNATLRYEEYEKLATQAWRKHGVRPKIKSTVRLLPPGRGGFEARSLSAAQYLAKFKTAIDNQFGELVYSKVAKTDAAWLAAMDLAVVGRVANPDALSAVLHAWRDKRIELIQMDGHVYIDIGAPPDQIGGRSPVQRFLLPSRSARLVRRAQSLDRNPLQIQTPDWVKTILREFGLPGDLDTPKMVAWVCAWVDAANRIEFPGLVAGMLGGRVPSYALWGEDCSRAEHDIPRIHPLHPPHPDDESPSLSHLRPASPATNNGLEEKSALNRKLLADIRQVLQSAKDSKDSHKAKGELSDGRRKVLGAVNQVLKRAPEGLSPAVFALGEWVAHLLERPRHGNGVLTYSSISRYMSALSSGFLAFGEDIDFRELDSDDLEDFYLMVIDPSLYSNSQLEEMPEGSAEQNEDADTSEPSAAKKENQKYVLLRLKEFHSFSVRRYGLSSIDWSQVDQGLTGVLGRPGLITWQEYSHAFHCLCSSAESASLEELQSAMILLLCYRFGLRGGEAISLAKSDWVEPVDNAVVLLVSGRHRKLKTRASLRQIPLVHPLQAFERAVVVEWFRHWEARSQDNNKIPLFFSAADIHSVADMAPVRKIINEVLKKSTASDLTTLHHARHAFANLLAGSLLGDLYEMMPKAITPPGWNSKPIQKLLLGTESSTRRAPWALARALGHSRLNTTFGSYVHLIHPWTVKHIRANQKDTHLFGPTSDAVSNEIDIRNWNAGNRQIDVQSVKKSEENHVAVTPELKMQYLRLRSYQVSPKVAAREFKLNPATCEALETQTTSIARIIFTDLKALDDALIPGMLLNKIKAIQWERLTEKSKSLSTINPSINWINHISKNRQLLLWRASHFALMDEILAALDFKWSDFDIFAPKLKNSTFLKELEQRNINPKSPISATSTDHQGVKKIFQIDTAMEIDKDGTATTFKERVATVPSNSSNYSTYDLIILLLAASSPLMLDRKII